MRVKVCSSSPIPIRAAVLCESGRPLRIECLELEGQRQDKVLVRLLASGICHTDIDFCDSGGGSRGADVSMAAWAVVTMAMGGMVAM